MPTRTFFTSHCGMVSKFTGPGKGFNSVAFENRVSGETRRERSRGSLFKDITRGTDPLL